MFDPLVVGMLSISAPLFLAWGLAAVALGWLAKRVLDAEAKRARPRDLRWVRIAAIVWSMLVPSMIAWYAARRNADVWSTVVFPEDALRGLLAGIAAPYFLVAIAATIACEHPAIRLQAPAGTRRELLQRRLVQLAMTLVFASWSLLAAGVSVHAERGVVFGSFAALSAAGVCAIVAAKRWVGGGAPASLLPMEATPLRDELDSIAAHFGFPGANWQLRTFRVREGVEMTATGEAMELGAWWHGFSLRRPVVPVALLRHLDSDAVTAVVAVRCSRAYRPGKPGLLAGVPGRIGAIALTVAILLGSGLLLRVLAPSLVFLFPPVALLVAAGFLVVRLGNLQQTKRNHVAAWEAWRHAAPGEHRSPARFVRCLFEFDCLLMPDSRATVARLIRANRSIIDFLDAVAPEERETILGSLAGADEGNA